MTDPLRDELAAALRQSVAEASDYRGDLDANLCIRLLATYGVTLTREPGLDERDPHFYSKALMRQGREPGHGSRVVTPLDVAWDALIDEGWVGFEAAKARHRPVIEAAALASLEAEIERLARRVAIADVNLGLCADEANRLRAEVERLRRIEHAARDVDGMWSEPEAITGLLLWAPETAETLLDLRAALEEPTQPTINEYGRAMCACGVSVLPENWPNHLLSQRRGPHRAALKEPTP